MIFASEVIRAAIDLNWLRLNDPIVRSQRPIIGEAAFLHEYATVRLNMGRCAGHSTYIQENALSNDLIVTRNRINADEFRGKKNVFTAHQIEHFGTTAGRRFDRVWVDVASLVFDNRESEYLFFQSMAGSRVNQIIMLG